MKLEKETKKTSVAILPIIRAHRHPILPPRRRLLHPLRSCPASLPATRSTPCS